MSGGERHEPEPNDASPPETPVEFPPEIDGLLTHWGLEQTAAIQRDPERVRRFEDQLRSLIGNIPDGEDVTAGRSDAEVAALAAGVLEALETHFGDLAEVRGLLDDLQMGELRIGPGVTALENPVPPTPVGFRGRTNAVVQLVWPGFKFDSTTKVRHSENADARLDRASQDGHAQDQFKEDQPDIRKEEPTPRPRSQLMKVFRQATSRDLSALPLDDLEQMESRLADAKVIKAKQLVGMELDDPVTVAPVNQYLADHVGEPLDEETCILLSRLVSHLRTTYGYRLVLETEGGKRTCSMTSVARSDRGNRRLELLSTERPQTRLWSRTSLPPGLSLE